MITVIDRLFRVALQPYATPRRMATLKDLQTIRSALLKCVEDCEGLPVDRLRHQVDRARRVQELWLLRNDAYQLISQRHSQAVATDRINGLIHCFEAFIDPRQLGRIH